MENSQPRPTGVAKWLLVFGLLLVANSAYLAAFGDPSLFYVVNALLHPLLGIVAAILLVVLMARHGRSLGGAGAGAAANGGRSSTGEKLMPIFLVLAAACGVYLMFAGMTRPHSLALYVHVGAAIAGIFLLLVVLRGRIREAGVLSRVNLDRAMPNRPPHPQPLSPKGARGVRQVLLSLLRGRALNEVPPSPPWGRGVGGEGVSPHVNYKAEQETRAAALVRAWQWAAAVMVASALFYCAVAIYHRLRPDPQYLVRNPETPPLTMEGEGGGPNSLMFPSSATTTDGKPITSQFFMDSESCKPCHTDI
jgi:hypothetical protein